MASIKRKIKKYCLRCFDIYRRLEWPFFYNGLCKKRTKEKKKNLNVASTSKQEKQKANKYLNAVA